MVILLLQQMFFPHRPLPGSDCWESSDTKRCGRGAQHGRTLTSCKVTTMSSGLSVAGCWEQLGARGLQSLSLDLPLDWWKTLKFDANTLSPVRCFRSSSTYLYNVISFVFFFSDIYTYMIFICLFVCLYHTCIYIHIHIYIVFAYVCVKTYLLI